MPIHPMPTVALQEASIQATVTAPPETMEVRYQGGEHYEIAVREHRVSVGQPVDAGGEDLAPTPTGLFVAAVASCVAFYAGRYLTRHGLPRDGLAVAATYRMATDRPARVTSVHLTVRVPDALPVQRRPRCGRSWNIAQSTTA